MSHLMRAISAIGFACLLALGFAGAANAAEAAGVSKAVYSSTDNPLMQAISYKPCCHNPYNGAYARSTPSTCRKYGGYIVQDRFCGGYGYQPNPVYPVQPGYPVHPGYPGWNNGYPQGGQAVCCKRKRRDWWSPNTYTCQQQGGRVVHPNYCYND